MTSGLKTRNPLVLFEGNPNPNPIPKSTARNPITQEDVSIPIATPKKPVARNPIIQTDNAPIQKPLGHPAKTLSRNPIVADPNEFKVKVRETNTFKDSNIFVESNQNRPSTTKAKHTPTFSSTLFGGPKIEAPNRKKLVTDLSTDQLFGDYKDPPVVKTKKKEYNPNFETMSPEQRRYIEVFGNERPPANGQKEKEIVKEKNIENENKDAFSKKMNSLDSNIFYEKNRPQTTKAEKPKEKFFAKTNWDSQICAPQADNQRRDIDSNYAFSKKQEEFLKSNVFGQTNDINLNANAQKQINFKDDTNEDKRKAMRNYSDLFNLTQYETQPLPKNEQIEEKKIINENVVNLDPHAKRLKDLYSVLDNHDLTKAYQETLLSEKEKKTEAKKFEGKQPKDLKQMELKSNMLGNQDRDVNYDNLKNPVFYDLDLNGVSQDFDPNSLKKFCANKGYHLVEYKANMNSLNTGNNGTGRLKIRVGDDHELNHIKQKLSELGMDAQPHIEKHELKHNYTGVANLNWTDSNLANEERRLDGKNFVDHKESKMRELESNGDVFGSSQGVGKWDSEWKSNKKNKKAGEDNFTPEDNVQHMNWKKSMKNLEKMKNPMYKAGTSYQNQRLFSSTSTKSFSTYKK